MLLANGASQLGCADSPSANRDGDDANSSAPNPGEAANLVSRIKNFVNHLQRSTHPEPEFHDQHQDMLEDAFHCGQDEEQYHLFSHLSTRPAFLFETAKMSHTEGKTWKAK